MVRQLTRRRILEIHETVVKESGGETGVLSEGSLDAALAVTNLSLFGQMVHRSLVDKAAALFHELCKLHPFVDANKRTAYTAADVFLNLNGRELKANQTEAVRISLRTARCDADQREVRDWVLENSRRTTF
ncbi:MAG: type II toxin-antitoxin system death-on-curing family toxin [Candidatus Geothermarchaeales archaeon]